MTSQQDRTDGAVDWPAQFERTPASQRVHTSKFGVTFHEALRRIETELLDRVGADDWRVSTAAPHRKQDGMPYANANPSDPAVVVRWSKDGQQFAVACDHYTDWRDNARAIGLYIREKRKMSDRPVTTGQSEFATARLPSGNEEAIVADAPADQPAPHEVLDVTPDAPEDVVEAAYRQKTKTAHPDQGGSAEELKRVRQAKEAMLDGGER
ncbi:MULTISPECIES: J domain-containing protein [Salinibaculum]|uniref:J domain-containing protein n=1 Tax=Salinibaculum TaxID=2732368 RepID=UPI0030CC92F0